MLILFISVFNVSQVSTHLEIPEDQMFIVVPDSTALAWALELRLMRTTNARTAIKTLSRMPKQPTL